MDTTIPSQYMGACESSTNTISHAQKLLQTAEQEIQTRIRTERLKLAGKIRSLKSQAHTRGYIAGKNEAERKALSKLLEIEREYQRNIHTSQNDCLALAISIAEEILEKEIKTSPSSLVERIKNRLNGLLHLRKASITVNPRSSGELYALLQESIPQVDIDIETDDNMSLGDAKIETHAGSIDVNWREQFKTLTEHLQTKLQEKLLQ